MAPSRTTVSTTMSEPGRASPDRPLEIAGGARLVGIDEDKVEGSFGGEARQCVKRAAHTNLDEPFEPGSRDIGARHLGVIGVGLERDETPLGEKRTGEPDRAVAAKRSDLQNLPCADGTRQQHEELALIGRDADRRQTGRFACLECRRKRRVVLDEMGGDEVIDRIPNFSRS